MILNRGSGARGRVFRTRARSYAGDDETPGETGKNSNSFVICDTAPPPTSPTPRKAFRKNFLPRRPRLREKKKAKLNGTATRVARDRRQRTKGIRRRRRTKRRRRRRTTQDGRRTQKDEKKNNGGEYGGRR